MNHVTANGVVLLLPERNIVYTVRISDSPRPVEGNARARAREYNAINFKTAPSTAVISVISRNYFRSDRRRAFLRALTVRKQSEELQKKNNEKRFEILIIHLTDDTRRSHKEVKK